MFAALTSYDNCIILPWDGWMFVEYALISFPSEVSMSVDSLSFQQNDLRRVFGFCLQVLHELEKMPTPLSREVTTVFNRFLAITEQVLSWEFTHKHHIL